MFSVLIVDDDPGIRHLFSLLLQRFGCQTKSARNGVEGQNMALELRPDLILLDVMMDEQDGYETCANLRGLDYAGRIIMVSAVPYEEGRPKAEQNGADGYLEKPIASQALKAVIASLQPSPA